MSNELDADLAGKLDPEPAANVILSARNSLGDVTAREAEAVAFLALPATRLRAEGATRRDVLMDGRNERVVARLRVWR